MDGNAELKIKKIPTSERAILGAVLMALRWRRDVKFAHRMNTGATVYAGKDGRKRFVRYGFPGCSDIIGMMADGRFLAIETKRRNGEASIEQENFLQNVRDGGGVAGVCRSVEDVVELLDAAQMFPVAVTVTYGLTEGSDQCD